MMDTIELLDAIGRDSDLRHASPEDLTLALEKAGASEALMDAASRSDKEPIRRELGATRTDPPQIINAPAHEEEPEEEEKEIPSKPSPDRDQSNQ